MTGTLNENAYNSPRDLMEQALSSPRGIRVRFPNRPAAQSMKNRMATVVTMERKRNTKIYEPDSPLYGKSQYETLSTYIIDSWDDPSAPKDKTSPEWMYPWVWLYICPEHSPNTGRVVELL